MSIKIEFSSNNHSCQTTPNSNVSSQVSSNAQRINNSARAPLGLNAREIREMDRHKLDDNIDFSSHLVQQYIQQYNEVAQNYYNKKYNLAFSNLLNSGK